MESTELEVKYLDESYCVGFDYENEEPQTHVDPSCDDEIIIVSVIPQGCEFCVYELISKEHIKGLIQAIRDYDPRTEPPQKEHE